MSSANCSVSSSRGRRRAQTKCTTSFVDSGISRSKRSSCAASATPKRWSTTWWPTCARSSYRSVGRSVSSPPRTRLAIAMRSDARFHSAYRVRSRTPSIIHWMISSVDTHAHMDRSSCASSSSVTRSDSNARRVCSIDSRPLAASWTASSALEASSVSGATSRSCASFVAAHLRCCARRSNRSSSVRTHDSLPRGRAFRRLSAANTHSSRRSR